MDPVRRKKAVIATPEYTPASATRWQSVYGWPMPNKQVSASDGLPAETACRLISQGVGIMWSGDYHEAQALLKAIKRRLNLQATTKAASFEALPWPQRFHRIRLQRAQIARQIGLLIVRVSSGYRLPYRRAPDATAALESAYGERLADVDFMVSLTELVGVISAYEWHCKGLPVQALGQSIYPRWGVFTPTRHEYLDLVMQASLPAHCQRAVDVGTGSGVLAMLLAQRGVPLVVATDTNPAAVACATENITRAGLQEQIKVTQTHLIPEGTYDLLVCNPPWLPGTSSGPLDAAVYDPKSQMLRGFLESIGQHLTAQGQAWLILSDLAEHLNLRSREDLLQWISQAGLKVDGRLDIKPTHRKLANTGDPMASVRQAEITSLWQLSSLDETL